MLGSRRALTEGVCKVDLEELLHLLLANLCVDMADNTTLSDREHWSAKAEAAYIAASLA
jgi:hypothetical protein